MKLHIKLSRTAKELRIWAKQQIPQGKLAMVICREVILQLDVAQETRPLSEEQRSLKKMLKSRLLGLVAIEKSRARQKSRLTWLRKGDANSKYFQIYANAGKKKNFIHSLEVNDRVVTEQNAKHDAIHEHFLHHIGTHVLRKCSINYAAIG